jgi:hypothetical protein
MGADCAMATRPRFDSAADRRIFSVTRKCHSELRFASPNQSWRARQHAREIQRWVSDGKSAPRPRWVPPLVIARRIAARRTSGLTAAVAGNPQEFAALGDHEKLSYLRAGDQAVTEFACFTRVGPWKKASAVSTEIRPAPKINTISETMRKAKGAAAINLSGSEKKESSASRSPIT